MERDGACHTHERAHTSRATALTRLMPLLAAALCWHCEPPTQEAATATLGVDGSLVCPEGYISYTKSPGGLTIDGVELKPTVSVSVAVGRPPDPCKDYTAGPKWVCDASVDHGVKLAQAEVDQACSGRKRCEYVSRHPAYAWSYSYTCGVGADDPDKVYQASVTGDLGNRRVVFDCSKARTAPVDDAQAKPAESVCVPKFCFGNTRRNADMSCVEDRDMAHFSASQTPLETTGAGISRRFEDWTSDVSNVVYPIGSPRKTPKLVTLNPNTNYLRREVLRAPRGWDDSRALKITYWMVDHWMAKDPRVFEREVPKVELTDSRVHETFRCVLFELELRLDASGKLVAEREEPLNNNCLKPGPGRINDPGKHVRKGLQSANSGVPPYAYIGSYVYRSIDMDGEHVVDLGGDQARANGEPCGPNPIEFFYDRQTREFDYLAYYRQRQLEGSAFAKYGFPTRYTPTTDPGMLRIHTGPLEPEPSFVVSDSPAASRPVSVRVNWSMDGKHPKNPRSPPNAGLGNLFARVYAWPSGKNLPTDPKKVPLLGSVPLREAAITGSTVTHEFEPSYAVRRKFFDSRSPLFISAQQKKRQFDLFYCLDTDNGSLTAAFPGRDALKLHTGIGYVGSKHIVALDSVDEFGKLTHKRDRPKERLGCGYAGKPTVIFAERLYRPAEPIGNALFAGLSDTTEAGGSIASAAQDNDSEVTCASMDDKFTLNCDEVAEDAMMSGGTGGRSVYANTSVLKRSRGSKAGYGSRIEMLGFTTVDTRDMGGSGQQLDWSGRAKGPQASTPFKISVTPPWDQVIAAARKATARSPVRWKKGRYAGQTGLGVGWGFKKPFQIGPIPGLATFTFSVGISTTAYASLQLAPEDDDAYACLNRSKPCYVSSGDSTATFADAHAACLEGGGRLAQLDSSAEVSAIRAALGTTAGGDHWVGGQQTHSFADPACHDSYVSSRCEAGAVASYRWLVRDAEFASSTARNPGRYGNNFHSGRPNLVPSYPDAAGIVFDAKADSAGFRALGTGTDVAQLPYICRFEGADSTSYLKVAFGGEIGVAAGFGVEVCSPNPDVVPIHICVGGALNLVAMKISIENSRSSYWLDRGGDPFLMLGTTGLEVPWSITVLEGALSARAQLFWTSASWDIATFDGFKLDSGKLIDLSTSYQVR